MEAASHVVHRECRAAPLSPELSEQQNFRGLLNLGGLIIFVTNFRLIVENLLKYGLLLKFDGALWTSWRAWPCCSTLLAMNAFIVISYCLERYMAAEAKKPALKGHHAWLARLEKRVGWLHAFNITAMCLVVLFVIQYNNVDPSTHPTPSLPPPRWSPSPPPLPVGCINDDSHSRGLGLARAVLQCRRLGCWWPPSCWS
jgi:hypothetical protein